MPENQRKNRHSRGHHAKASPQQRQEDVVEFEREQQTDRSTLDDELPNPAWVDDRSGRLGPPPRPGIKIRRPQRRG